MSDSKSNLILLPGVERFAASQNEESQKAQESAVPEVEPPPPELLLPVLEAVLFAADRPLSVSELQEVLGLKSPQQIRAERTHRLSYQLRLLLQPHRAMETMARQQ